ncbi:hypothetical protein HPP92_025849 [Vanilla planifolia]|uniref:Uncharacterized protein n=1 Tax=Vanilla planifolia TaxID=51239 RepID=A0A835U8A6_VANPL|nr:hypothetical protein HPP92_025849 [Vanilla planifolia]
MILIDEESGGVDGMIARIGLVVEAEGLAIGGVPCIYLLNVESWNEQYKYMPLVEVLLKIQQEILHGCVLVSSRFFSSKSWLENEKIWKMAEQLGTISFQMMLELTSLDRQ